MGVVGRANLRLNRMLSHWRNSHRDTPSAWRMIKLAGSEYKNDWWLYVKILLVVLIPSAVLATYVVPSGTDTSLSAYVAVANSLMNAALILAIVRRGEKIRLSIKKAYYEGSALLVRLFLLTALIGLMLLPMFVGLIIFSVGFSETEDILSAAEKLMLAILAVIFTIPSLTMLTRAVFSLYIVAETNKGPWEAVSASRSIVRGRALAVFGRIAALILFMLVVVTLPIVGLVFLGSTLQAAWPGLILQILLGIIVLPYTNLYLYRLYQEIK